MNTEVVCTPGSDAFEVRNEATSGNTSPASWFYKWATGGGRSDSGMSVNGYTALTHCSLWQGVNVIAGDIAQTPVRLLRNEFDEQRKHPAWNLLRLRPNSLQTPMVYTETIIQWALIWGNGVSWIVKNGSRPEELIPLRPDCLWPELVSFDERQELLYHYWSPTAGKEYLFFPDQVCHIPGLTSDGVWGYPLHQIGKNTIGHGLALEKHGNKSFSNGARPSGVLKHPGKMTPEARANLRGEWNDMHAGAENSGKIAILQEAMEFQAMAMTNIDAQWLEAKKANVYEVASLLNLPPHKIGAIQDSSVRANLEEQNSDYAQRTLTRWYSKLAQEYKRKLLTDREWLSDEYEFVYDVDQFLRADIDTLSQVADRLVHASLLAPNEGRRWFRLPPYPDGEKFGSPAINPRPTGGNATETPPKAPNPTETSRSDGGGVSVHSAHRDLLLDRTAHLIDCESTRLKHAASNVTNFVAWLDDFYVGGAQPSKFTGIYQSVMAKSVKAACAAGILAHGLEPALATWAMRRRNAIMDACSIVTRDGLPGMVESFICNNSIDTAEQILLAALEVQDGAQNN